MLRERQGDHVQLRQPLAENGPFRSDPAQCLRYRTLIDQPSSQRLYRRGPLRSVWPSTARPLTHRAARNADAAYGVSDTPDWREIDWPSQTNQVEINGRAINYVDLGEGDQTVLFIHGLGGSWQNWLENLPRTAESCRAIAIDLPGFGRSEMPTDPISITGFAAAVNGFCDALELGPVVLVGNSMGGFTAAEIAIQHPERVETLVLVDAAGISSANVTRSRSGERLARQLMMRGQGDPGSAKKMLTRPGFIAAGMGLVARYPTKISKQLLAEQILTFGDEGFGDAFEAILGYDFRHRLEEIGCPVLVIQGENDILVPLGDAIEFCERIPNATLLTLADTGHVPMFERPVQFNDALLTFVAAPTPATS
jgi:pimeloyl-ACP methyl ester carboxylesterase